MALADRPDRAEYYCSNSRGRVGPPDIIIILKILNIIIVNIFLSLGKTLGIYMLYNYICGSP